MATKKKTKQAAEPEEGGMGYQMSKHLIIGLGGTGGKIIRSLRKAIFQEFRTLEPAKLSVDFLYVDASNEMMQADPAWEILGTSVRLEQAKQLHLTDAGLQAILEHIENYPGLKGWLEDPKPWRDLLTGGGGGFPGGLNRRLDRLLFTIHVEKFYEQLQAVVGGLQQGETNAPVTFHVLAGLAEGTGSGCLIDVLCLIRQLYTDPRNFRLVVYALLPEQHPAPGWDTGNYHANSYAALLELNALSVGSFSPHDITGKQQCYQVQDPFQGCYLFADENANGLIVDMNRELPEIAADFLYQKIVAIQDMGNWVSLVDVENAENGDATPESSSNTNRPERGKRFLSCGIKRLVISQEAIREYLNSTFTNQVSRQLLYNNWQVNRGYEATPKTQNFFDLVRQDDQLARWKLSDEEVCLSLGNSPGVNNPTWQSISEDWQEVMPRLKDETRNSMEPMDNWLDKLGQICAKYFKEGFRGVGVQNFFEDKLKKKDEIAQEIRQKLETDLFEEWRQGTTSLLDIRTLLASLQAATAERLQTADNMVNSIKQMEAAAEDKKIAYYLEWSKIGILGTVRGKRKKLFESHAEVLQDLYIARTYLEAWQFAKELLGEFLNKELIDVLGDVDKAIDTLKRAQKTYEDRLALLGTVEGLTDLKSHIVRFYEPEIVRRFTGQLVKDEETQRQLAKSVRDSLMQKVGGNNYYLFNERIPLTTLMNTLETGCEPKAAELLQNPKNKALGVNIIEKIADRYGSDVPALQKFIAELVQDTGHFITFSETERQQRGPGIPETPTCLNRFTVFLPQAEETDFLAALKGAFDKAYPGVEIISGGQKLDTLTLVNVFNLFPLRFVSLLAFLKEKYESWIGTAKHPQPGLEVHLEGDGSQFPDLFWASTAEVAPDGLPYLLIARSMGIILRDENHLFFNATDQHGAEKQMVLGGTLPDAIESLDDQRVNSLKEKVEKLVRAEKSEDILNYMKKELQAIETEEGAGSKTYQWCLEAAPRAAAIIKGEI